MVVNVWMRILPAQRQMIAALKEGDAARRRLAARAKLRSKHNTFMVVPVVFTMISNHFPVSTYGHQYNWLILSALVLVGLARGEDHPARVRREKVCPKRFSAGSRPGRVKSGAMRDSTGGRPHVMGFPGGCQPTL